MSAENRQNCDSSDETANQIKQENVDILPGYSTFEQFTRDGFKTLMEAIRHSNALPMGGDYNFYNTYDSFKEIMSEGANEISSMINVILRKHDVGGNIKNRALEEKTELVVEANDIILEQVANNIDEMNGIRKTTAEPVLIQAVSAQLPINGSWNRMSSATFSISSSLTSGVSNESSNVSAIRLLTAKNIIRPQKFFKDKIINSSKYPWEPRIKEKPNSLKPLAIFLEETENGHEYSHPYEYELDRFTPLESQLEQVKCTKPKPVNDTPLIEIDTPRQLEQLVTSLRSCDVFAVDLEHHSYRSFMGITCLMQISTRDKDYIIDTFALRDRLCILNEVFTKPTIVKVFHGADMDIKWLQRDLSLYVVNMFDTHQAAKVLGYSGLSLSFLLQKFCNYVPNKHFQLADWRIRPLPDELKMYAREDTHYLIYIYEMMKNEILEKANGHNLLLSTFKNSTEICKKRYLKPIFHEESYLDFYRKCKRLFDNRQLYALKELYKWRDKLSREEDESTGYVLPNHMLLQICESLPREMQGILACCNPIPPLVRANLLELHNMILKAREQPLEKAILKEDTRGRGTTKKISKINVDSPLHCPHDLTKSEEFRDDLPILLDKFQKSSSTQDLAPCSNLESLLSSYSVFNTPDNSEDEDIRNTINDKLPTFLGPYERYKLVKPFIQAEEEKLAAEKVKELTDGRTNRRSEPPEPTDEERIESIRKHFLTLSRASAKQQNHPERTLVELGGSKKRKREVSEEQDINNEVEPQNNLHTPAPNRNYKNFSNRGKKGRFRGANDFSPNKMPRNDYDNPSDLPQSNNPYGNNRSAPKKKKNKRFNQSANRQQNSNTNKNRKFSQNRDEINSTQSQQTQFEQNQPESSHTSNNSNVVPSKKQKKKNKQFNQGSHLQNNPSQNFTPYDYSSVDFRQFQGGANGAQGTTQIKSNFKRKGKKKNANRGNNKTLTFGNFGRGKSQ